MVVVVVVVVSSDDIFTASSKSCDGESVEENLTPIYHARSMYD